MNPDLIRACRGRGNTPRRKGMLVEVNRDLSSEQWDKPGSGSEKALKQILMENSAAILRDSEHFLGIGKENLFIDQQLLLKEGTYEDDM